MHSRITRRVPPLALGFIIFLLVICIPYTFFVTNITFNFPTIKTTHNNPVRTVTNCQDRLRLTRVEPRGQYLVFYNLLPARREYLCHESVTLTTQGDYTFLGNLEMLVEKWQGPVSVALYAPGYDFQATLHSIMYLKHCGNGIIEEFVTFHVFYEMNHYDKVSSDVAYNISTYLQQSIFDCSKWSKETPFDNINRAELYKTKNSLSYPINVARNIALESAQTHFVLASDMELMPSDGIINKFLNMIATKPYLESSVNETNRHVYGFAVFEVQEHSKLPSTKTALQKMYFNHKQAQFFHEKLCLECHVIPQKDKWIKQFDDQQLDVFKSVKRQGNHRRWEPFYIGTHMEPPFDERVTWEGSSNKMIQAFTLCSLDYDIRVLDDVFLVHKPGLSKKTAQNLNDRKKMSSFILETIVPELQHIYGKRKGCIVGGEFTRDELL